MVELYAYLDDGRQILRMDGTQGFLPDAMTARMLCDKKGGVGADRLLVFTGTEAVPSFTAYLADGTQEDLTAEDYALLARAEEDYSVTLTDDFVRRMQRASSRDHHETAAVA